MSATNKLLSNKRTAIKNAKEMTALLFDTTELEKKQTELLGETELISDMVQAAINENATTALNQKEFQKRYDSLSAKFDAAKEELDKVTQEIDEKQQQKAKIEIFIKQFQKSPDVLTSFSLEAWNSLADYITVYSKDNIVFTFKNGQEIKTELKKSHY